MINWKEYLTFSRSQQSGILVLLILIVLVVILPLAYKLYNLNSAQPNLSFTENIQIDGLHEPLPDPKIEDSLFYFDPNTINLSELKKLGLTEKLARTIIKYRDAGGRFEQPSDLSKIYHFPDSTYRKLLPYINIRELSKTGGTQEVNHSNPEFKSQETMPSHKAVEIIELNSVDSATLISLPGIGPAIAKRIISYRQFLGGYYTVEQLKEVYNLQPQTYALLKDRFYADTNYLVKINLNLVEFKQLNKHPYLSYSQIKALLSYRKTMGKFNHTSDVYRYKLLDSVTYQQIKPYLTVN